MTCRLCPAAPSPPHARRSPPQDAQEAALQQRLRGGETEPSPPDTPTAAAAGAAGAAAAAGAVGATAPQARKAAAGAAGAAAAAGAAGAAAAAGAAGAAAPTARAARAPGPAPVTLDAVALARADSLLPRLATWLDPADAGTYTQSDMRLAMYGAVNSRTAGVRPPRGAGPAGAAAADDAAVEEAVRLLPLLAAAMPLLRAWMGKHHEESNMHALEAAVYRRATGKKDAPPSRDFFKAHPQLQTVHMDVMRAVFTLERANKAAA